jgi:hypothetical protein
MIGQSIVYNKITANTTKKGGGAGKLYKPIMNNIVT